MLRWLALLTLIALDARALERGAPPLQIWLPEDYGAHSQNWWIEQGPDGLIHVGNGHGLLEFDGARWSLLETPGRTRVRRFLFKPNGQMLAATTDSFAAIEPDAAGQRHWRSRAHELPDRAFGESMGLAQLGADVYLLGNRALFRIGPDGHHSWRSDAGFQQGFALGTRFLVLERALGLAYVDAHSTGETVTLYPGGEAIAGDQIGFVLEHRAAGSNSPGSAASALIGTMKHGLLRLSEDGLTPWPTAIDPWLAANLPLGAVALDDGSLVIASFRGGVVHLAADGQPIQFLDESDGLPDNAVYAIARDDQGQVWLAQDGGVTQIALRSAISVFDRRHGVRTVWGITRFRERLLLATRAGVLAMVSGDQTRDPARAAGNQTQNPARAAGNQTQNPARAAGNQTQNPARAAGNQTQNPARLPRFERIAALPLQSWEFAQVDGRLLLAGGDGVWEVLPDDGPPGSWPARNIARARFGYSLLALTHPTRVLAATEQGVLWLTPLPDGSWHSQPLGDYRSEVRQFAAAANGHVYAGTPRGRLLDIDLSADPPKLSVHAAVLPEGISWPIRSHGEVLLGTAGGLKRLAADGRIEASIPAVTVPVARGLQGRTQLWLAAATRVVAHPSDPADTLDLSAFAGVADETIYAFHEDPDGVLWIGRERGLVRFDPAIGSPLLPIAPPRLRALQTRADDGRFIAAATATRWPPDTGAVRVRFAAARLGGRGAQYRTRLTPIETAWSPWEAADTRELSALGGGDYQLEIEARDAFDAHELGTLVVPFAISNPWYLSAWALAAWSLLAALGLLGAGLGLARWRHRRLIAAHRALEQTVAERTEQLRHQATSLRALDLAKSRFFAGITHDVRTPLTLVLEPLREALAGNWGALPHAAARELERAERNARRLQSLIGELLNLQALEAGPRLQLRSLDVRELLQASVAQFEGGAHRRGLRLDLEVPAAPCPAAIDALQFEKVLANLLGNALRFARTRILVALETRDEVVLISVSDDGPGVAADEREQLFDRFFRGRDAHGPGMGIGLALVREIVEQHGGKVEVDPPGEGARFLVRLPATAALAPTDPASTPPDDTEAEAEAGAKTADRTTILVVDDNAELRAFLATRLKPNYRVIEAADGIAGLAAAQQELPDLIVSDVQMPHCDGLELLRRLRADRETDVIPVILLASLGTIEARLAGLRVGADDYLEKPFHSEELHARIAGIIAARRQLRLRLSEQNSTNLPPLVPAPPQDPFLAKVIDAIHARLDDPGFNVAELAGAVFVDRTTLFRRLKALQQPTPVQLILSERLDHAATLLRGRQGSVTEVAYGCGFESLSYFSRSFKERFGVVPSACQGSESGA